MAQRNPSMKLKETHRLREQTYDCHGVVGGKGMNWEFGVDRYKLLHLGWINNRVLLYSIGNCIQYPVINCNGKAYLKKECIF